MMQTEDEARAAQRLLTAVRAKLGADHPALPALAALEIAWAAGPAVAVTTEAAWAALVPWRVPARRRPRWRCTHPCVPRNILVDGQGRRWCRICRAARTARARRT